MTVVDASAKVKWVHAKVFVFTKLVYLLLCVHVQHSSHLSLTASLQLAILLQLARSCVPVMFV